MKRDRSAHVSCSLRVKAMTAVALLLLASASIIGFAALRVTHAELLRAYKTRINYVLDATALKIEPMLATPVDDEAVDRAVQEPARTNGVVFCACFGRDGTLLGFQSAPEFDEPLRPQLMRQGATATQAMRLTTRGGEPVVLQSAPIVSYVRRDAATAAFAKSVTVEREVGTVVLGYTLTPVAAQYAPVASRVWRIVGGVGLAAALIAWLIAGSLVKPIRAVVLGTQRLARGDFDHPVDVRSHDEIAQLAASFNSMTNELAESRARVAHQKEILEEAVKQRTRKLRSAYSELQVLDKMKDAFLSSISHEFRTPITSIRAFAELMQQEPAMDPATRQEFAAIILRESVHLCHLVSDVLDLVKMESGAATFRFARHSPADLAQAAVQQVANEAKAKQLAIEVEPAPDLPAVLWDGAKITRLLLELLENSIRFSSEGGRVTISISRAGELVRLEVRDEGTGIALCDLETIFERFHQGGEVLTDKPQGQGLGLPICRLIALGHGGTIRAASAPRGAHLIVDLPVEPSAAVRLVEPTVDVVTESIAS